MNSEFYTSKWVSHIVTFLLGGIVIAFIFLVDSTQDRSEEDSSEKDLFIQTSQGGSLVPVDGSSEELLLTFTDPNPQIIFFSDRPIRNTGIVQFARFAENVFDPSLADPNAGLVITNEEVKNLIIPLSISNPKQLDNGTVTYSAVLIANPEDELIESLQTDEINLLTDIEDGISFSQAELFIDSGGFDDNCYGQISSNVDLVLNPFKTDPASSSIDWAQLTESISKNSGNNAGTFNYGWNQSAGDTGPSFDIYYDAVEYRAEFKLHTHCWDSFWDGPEVRSMSCTISGVDASKFTCSTSTYDRDGNDAAQFAIRKK